MCHCDRHRSLGTVKHGHLERLGSPTRPLISLSLLLPSLLNPQLQAEAPNRRPWRRRIERATPSSSGGQENEDEVSASPRGPLRKCWQTLCSWIFRNRRDGRSGEVSASGEAEVKARVLEEFRELVKRHPGQLRRRARKVRHELDDVLLVRWLKYVYAQGARSVDLSRRRSAPP